MGFSELGNILKVFRGGERTAEEKQALFRELLLMTLARASSADTNINPCEVATVQGVLEEILGESVSVRDVRVAAASALYESAPLEAYVARVSSQLEPAQRASVAKALARVITSDCRVSPNEVAFFDGVVRALNVSPAELMGLFPESP